MENKHSPEAVEKALKVITSYVHTKLPDSFTVVKISPQAVGYNVVIMTDRLVVFLEEIIELADFLGPAKGSYVRGSREGTVDLVFRDVDLGLFYDN